MKNTKRGVASIYIVLFATILFGVITLGFVRLMVSESSQSSDEDLSESAYDAALAGVEDAKVATSRYYSCKKSGGTNCGDIFDGDCGDYKLGKYLYDTGGEVKIQESSSGETNTPTEQAYTCVIISNETSDYRGTLDSASRVKVIPLRENGTAKDIGSIIFSWFSEANGTNFMNLTNGGYLYNSTSSTIPPMITLSLISVKTNADGSLVNLRSLEEEASLAKVINLPSTSGSSDLVFERNDLINSSKISQVHNPSQVICIPAGSGREFACQVTLKPDGCLVDQNGSCNAYLVASMPYGMVSTDFEVEIRDRFGNPLKFTDVQISVDSTGRANDLIRRVETRLSPSDDYFPYPQFEIDMSNGGDTNDLKKNFWITTNCWRTGVINGTCNNNNG